MPDAVHVHYAIVVVVVVVLFIFIKPKSFSDFSPLTKSGSVLGVRSTIDGILNVYNAPVNCKIIFYRGFSIGEKLWWIADAL